MSDDPHTDPITGRQERPPRAASSGGGDAIDAIGYRPHQRRGFARPKDGPLHAMDAALSTGDRFTACGLLLTGDRGWRSARHGTAVTCPKCLARLVERARVAQPAPADACEECGIRPFDKRGADRMAREIARLVQRGVIGSRSDAADALLDYDESFCTDKAPDDAAALDDDDLAETLAVEEAMAERIFARVLDPNDGDVDSGDPADWIIAAVEAMEDRHDDAAARDQERYERVERELADVWAAMPGGSEFLDPPDGGDVPLAEQVRRMTDALAIARIGWATALCELQYVPDPRLDLRGETIDVVARRGSAPFRAPSPRSLTLAEANRVIAAYETRRRLPTDR